MVGERIGNYRVVRQLGEGGMGVVYEAVRDDIGGRAAIKVLRPESALNPEAAARFFNEARAANLIDHPGIVKIFDYGQLPSGAPYLAMELLSGEALFQRMQRERRFSEPDTIRLGRQVAAALAAAHAKEVIHRDLKPENIFIVPDGEAEGGERAKILDFGIAKLARGQTGLVRTHTNMVMGTPIYMSPEQCKGGKHVDGRADVYALGVILFEMVAGRTPFVAEEGGEYIGMHLFKAPPALSSLAPTVSPGLEKAVSLMLRKEPQARPSMAEIAATLKTLGNFNSDVISVRALAGSGVELKTLPQKPSRAPEAVAVKPGRAPVLAPELVQQDSDVETIVIKSRGVPRPPVRKASPLPPAPRPPASVGPSQELNGDSTSVMSEAEIQNVVPKPAAHSLPPDWHPLEVAAAPSALSSLDPEHSGGEKFKPPGRSLQRRLRRLRYQAKQRIFGWIGISVTEQRSTPSGTMLIRRRNAVLIGASAVAIGTILLVLLFWPTAESGAPSSRSVPPIPAELAEALAAVQKAVDGSGDSAAALRKALVVARKYNHPAGWSAIGQNACQAGKLKLANEALGHLSADAPDGARARADVVLVCRESGVAVDKDGRLAPSAGTSGEAKSTDTTTSSETPAPPAPPASTKSGTGLKPPVTSGESGNVAAANNAAAVKERAQRENNARIALALGKDACKQHDADKANLALASLAKDRPKQDELLDYCARYKVRQGTNGKLFLLTFAP